VRADPQACRKLRRWRAFKAANERVLDVEPKLYEVQHLLNAATLLNRRMKELADRD
jgi:hypothetical protein